jgi:hypothetical protein
MLAPRKGAAGRALGQALVIDKDFHWHAETDMSRAGEAAGFPMPDAGGRAHPRRSGFRSFLSQAGHAGRLHAASLVACRSSAVRRQIPLCLRAK